MASDKEILAWSLERGGIVVTLDADFHAILAVSGAAGPSVIRIRRQGLNALGVVELVENVLAGFEAELGRGSLVTVKANKMTATNSPLADSEPGPEGRLSELIGTHVKALHGKKAPDISAAAIPSPALCATKRSR